MKTLDRVLAIAALIMALLTLTLATCRAQGGNTRRISLDALSKAISDSVKILTAQPDYEWRTVCEVRMITPAGRYLQTVFEDRDDNKVRRDSVITTGCPVCGSDSVVVFRRERMPMYEYDTTRNLDRLVHQEPITWDNVRVLHAGEMRFYICAECGTLYTGRQRK